MPVKPTIADATDISAGQAGRGASPLPVRPGHAHSSSPTTRTRHGPGAWRRGTLGEANGPRPGPCDVEPRAPIVTRSNIISIRRGVNRINEHRFDDHA